VLQHPPYSPDLSPCDFDIFGDLKGDIRGHRFALDYGFINSPQAFSRMELIIFSPSGINVLTVLEFTFAVRNIL
jgi:hypothetical protein